MASSYWDEAVAERYRAFQYSFAERPLAGRVVILAGGTGGLGGAATRLLAGEGGELDCAASLGPLEGAAIFPGDPARVSWESLDAAALRSSWDANFVGPMLLAKDLAEAMEQTGRGGSLVLLATMQALAPFTSSLNYAAPKAALVHAAR